MAKEYISKSGAVYVRPEKKGESWVKQGMDEVKQIPYASYVSLDKIEKVRELYIKIIASERKREVLEALLNEYDEADSSKKGGRILRIVFKENGPDICMSREIVELK